MVHHQHVDREPEASLRDHERVTGAGPGITVDGERETVGEKVVVDHGEPVPALN
jgi:hypothetical protein